MCGTRGVCDEGGVVKAILDFLWNARPVDLVMPLAVSIGVVCWIASLFRRDCLWKFVMS